MPGQLRVEIIGLKRLFQQGKHNQIRNQQIKIPLPRLRLHEEILIQFHIINYSFHTFEMTVIVLGGQVESIRLQGLCPVFLAFGLVSG